MDRTERLAPDARITELEMELGRNKRLQNYFSALASECNARLKVFETACTERLEVIERGEVIIKALEASCAERDLMIVELRSQHDEEIKRLHSQFENSFSWRVTRPLRVVTRVLRKVMKNTR